MLEISEIIAQAQQKGASDIHIVTGLPVKCRIDGKVQNLTEKVLTWEDCEYYAKCLAGDLFHEIECIGELDLARTFPCGARTRINLFRQQGAVSAAIRILADTIPEIEALNLPPVVSEFPEYRSGIILVTGETGSGKSTTLAAILNRINHTRRSHIITLEDPIEYIYEPDQCIINQREIGKDTRSYADGLRSILREDPDVILIGEMRDLNTIETALTAACEVMMVNSAIKNLIREGKTPQIDSFITMNAQDGSITMDNALLKMVREGTVTYETALGYARDREAFSKGRRG